MQLRQQLLLVVAVGIWYISSAICTATSKELLSSISSSSLSAIQFFLAFLCSCLLSKHQQGSFLPVDCNSPHAQEAAMQIGFFFAVGFTCVNGGFQVMHVSINETLRAAEPLFSVLLAFFWLKQEQISTFRTVALIPIVCGVSLSSYSNADFNLFGLLLATGANICFSFRSIFSKRLRIVHKMNHFHIFHYTLRYALMTQVLTVLLGRIRHGYLIDASSFLLETKQLIVFFVNGMAFFVYNQSSFYVLSQSHIVTHSVGNAFRRVFTILFAVVYFGKDLTLLNALGMAIAAFGALLYAKALALEDTQRTQLKQKDINGKAVEGPSSPIPSKVLLV